MIKEMERYLIRWEVGDLDVMMMEKQEVSQLEDELLNMIESWYHQELLRYMGICFRR